MPDAGAPFAMSRTWVEMRAMLSPQRETEAAEGRAGVGIDAGGVALLHDCIPGAIVRFEIYFSDSGNILQHFGANMVDDLLDAPGFEAVEHFVNQRAH